MARVRVKVLDIAYEFRIRGAAWGVPISGPDAERAMRSWVYSHGLADGAVVDVRDEHGGVFTFAAVPGGNDIVPWAERSNST